MAHNRLDYSQIDDQEIRAIHTKLNDKHLPHVPTHEIRCAIRRAILMLGISSKDPTDTLATVIDTHEAQLDTHSKPDD